MNNNIKLNILKDAMHGVDINVNKLTLSQLLKYANRLNYELKHISSNECNTLVKENVLKILDELRCSICDDNKSYKDGFNGKVTSFTYKCHI